MRVQFTVLIQLSMTTISVVYFCTGLPVVNNTTSKRTLNKTNNPVGVGCIHIQQSNRIKLQWPIAYILRNRTSTAVTNKKYRGKTVDFVAATEMRQKKAQRLWKCGGATTTFRRNHSPFMVFLSTITFRLLWEQRTTRLRLWKGTELDYWQREREIHQCFDLKFSLLCPIRLCSSVFLHLFPSPSR